MGRDDWGRKRLQRRHRWVWGLVLIVAVVALTQATSRVTIFKDEDSKKEEEARSDEFSAGLPVTNSKPHLGLIERPSREEMLLSQEESDEQAGLTTIKRVEGGSSGGMRQDGGIQSGRELPFGVEDQGSDSKHLNGGSDDSVNTAEGEVGKVVGAHGEEDGTSEKNTGGGGQAAGDIGEDSPGETSVRVQEAGNGSGEQSAEAERIFEFESRRRQEAGDARVEEGPEVGAGAKGVEQNGTVEASGANQGAGKEIKPLPAGEPGEVEDKVMGGGTLGETGKYRTGSDGGREGEAGGTSSEEPAAAQQVEAKWGAFASPPECEGKRIYMYDLPELFNQQFLDNCHTIHRSVDMCEAFSHGGAGWPAHVNRENSTSPKLIPEGAWYETDQFNLEIIFHARMKEYPCLTEDPMQATVFYIPFYPGLSIFRSLYEKDLKTRDMHAKMISHWLMQQPWWPRHEGRDHLLVITRVLIDFTRKVVRGDWGNTLMKQRYMRNCSILGIENHPSHARLTNVHAIPYPSSFHPSSDQDIRDWQKFVQNHKRTHLIAFAGADHGIGRNLRERLWKECHDSPEVCTFQSCRHPPRVCIMNPRKVMSFYLTGKFCLQPPGDTPTRKGMFDCLLAGSIPVLFHPETAGQHKWHLPIPQQEVTVYFPRAVYNGNASRLFSLLRQFPKEKMNRMTQRVIALIPHLAYAMPGHTIKDFKDAFELAVEKVVTKVSRLRLPDHPGLPSGAE